MVPNEVRDTAAKQRRGCEASGHGFAKQNHGTWPRDCFFIMSDKKGKREKMRKRKFSTVAIAGCLALSMAFSGCAKKSEGDTSAASTEAATSVSTEAGTAASTEGGTSAIMWLVSMNLWN